MTRHLHFKAVALTASLTIALFGCGAIDDLERDDSATNYKIDKLLNKLGQFNKAQCGKDYAPINLQSGPYAIDDTGIATDGAVSWSGTSQYNGEEIVVHVEFAPRHMDRLQPQPRSPTGYKRTRGHYYNHFVFNKWTNLSHYTGYQVMLIRTRPLVSTYESRDAAEDIVLDRTWNACD